MSIRWRRAHARAHLRAVDATEDGLTHMRLGWLVGALSDLCRTRGFRRPSYDRELRRSAGSARRWGVRAQMVFVAYTHASSLLAIGTILLGLVLAWAGCMAAGGSYSPAPHLFYLPIVLAVVRFSWPGGVLTAVAAGLFAGPGLPADVAAGTAQPAQDWLLRMGAFVTISVIIAALVRGRGEALDARMQDALVAARLVRAVARGEVEVHYQPIYRLDDMRATGFEALARWSDPRVGPVPPGVFVPAAERTGAIAVLDRHVLDRAVAQTRDWCDRFGPMTLSVNVSATRFARPDLAAEVEQTLRRHGLPAQTLQVEVTESALMDDIDMAARHLAELRQLGVRVAIDDFGTGRASLAYLDRFEVDTVKLDRSFLVRATTNRRTRHLLHGVARVLRDLDVEIVAEGIETDDQLRLLRDVGVGFGQGFLLGRPVPATGVDGPVSAASPDD